MGHTQPAELGSGVPAGTLADIALGAFRQLEHTRAVEAAADTSLADRERDHDAAALNRALQAPLVRWFPGVDWQLAERRLSGGAVVVRDPESGLLFRVSSIDGPWRVDLVSAGAGVFEFVTEVADLTGPADVGRWLHDGGHRAG